MTRPGRRTESGAIARYAFLGLAIAATGLVLLLVVLGNTRTGRWLFGLVAITGGSMIALGQLYEIHEGTVLHVRRSPDGKPQWYGSIQVEYDDEDGQPRRATAKVPGNWKAYEEIRDGDTVRVLVCRSDPRIVKVNGLPWVGRGKCQRATSQ